MRQQWLWVCWLKVPAGFKDSEDKQKKRSPKHSSESPDIAFPEIDSDEENPNWGGKDGYPSDEDTEDDA